MIARRSSAVLCPLWSSPGSSPSRNTRTGQARRGFVGFADGLDIATELAEQAYKRDSHVTGVTTGLNDMDRKLGGLHGSDLVIVAGRPAMGKTALATNIAFNAARALAAEQTAEQGGGKPQVVAFFSLEMSAEQLATRVLAEQCNVPSERISGRWPRSAARIVPGMRRFQFRSPPP